MSTDRWVRDKDTAVGEQASGEGSGGSHPIGATVGEMTGPIHAHPDGVVIDVWVVPGASRSEVSGLHGDAVRVRVAAPPEGGKANTALERLMAAASGAKEAIVISGHGSRRKRVVLEGVSLKAAAAAFLDDPR